MKGQIIINSTVHFYLEHQTRFGLKTNSNAHGESDIKKGVIVYFKIQYGNIWTKYHEEIA